MDLTAIVMGSLWSALCAAGLAVLLTAPYQYIGASFLCGFVGRFARDLFSGWGLNQTWSTVGAAFVVVLVAVAITRRHRVSPIVLVCSIIPLGAVVAMFNMIFELIKLSSAQGEALNASSVAFTYNMSKVLTTSLAIALGIGAGMAIVRLFTQERTVEV